MTGAGTAIQMSDEYLEEIKRAFDPEFAFRFDVLKTTIENYLCGFGSEVKQSMVGESQERAKRWIFGRQDYEFSFDEIWSLFYENITPDEARAQLKKVFEEKMKRSRYANKSKSNDGRRGRKDEDSGHDSDRGSVECIQKQEQPGADQWSWNLFFGTNDSGSGKELI